MRLRGRIDPGEGVAVEAQAAGLPGEVAGLLAAPLSTFLGQLGDGMTALLRGVLLAAPQALLGPLDGVGEGVFCLLHS